MRSAGVITIGIDPYIHLGPLTLAWHGLTIAIGVLLGGALAGRWLRERGLCTDPLWSIATILLAGALVGGRIFYLAEHGGLLELDRWFSSTGFTFDGGFIAVTAGIGVYVWRSRISLAYVDAVAAALPFGVAIGRLGDVINGEHHGPATTFFLGVRNSNPNADVPSNTLAYHSGGLYEVLLAGLIFSVIWPLRERLAGTPLRTTFVVVVLFSAGRFVEFFARSDSPAVGLGLSSAQWTSLVLLAAAVAGLVWNERRARASARGDLARRSPQAQSER